MYPTYTYTRPNFYEGPYSGLRGLIHLFRGPVASLALERGAAHEYNLIQLLLQHRSRVMRCFESWGVEMNESQIMALCADTLCCSALIHAGLVAQSDGNSGGASNVGFHMAHGMLWFHYVVLRLDGLRALQFHRDAMLALSRHPHESVRRTNDNVLDSLATIFAINASPNSPEDGLIRDLRHVMRALLEEFAQIRGQQTDLEDNRKMRRELERLGQHYPGAGLTGG